MIRTTRTTYLSDKYCEGLERTINKISWDKILQILPCYNKERDCCYTIIYKDDK